MLTNALDTTNSSDQQAITCELFKLADNEFAEDATFPDAEGE